MTIDPDLLDAARCDDRGVPLVGRSGELAALRRAGAEDLSIGRIYEGHVDALQLIARFGTSAQRTAAQLDAGGGKLFGVWNTQDENPVRIVAHGTRYRLTGAKSWASGATFVVRPLVTAAWPDGTSQLCLVPMENISPQIDGSAWRPLGMHDSQSFSVGFEGVTLEARALIGSPGDYERQPWFLGGALRFTAVQTGALERLVIETARYLCERSRDGDVVQTIRVGEMRVALGTALHWLEAGAGAWSAFDASPDDAKAAAAVDGADCARIAIERAALEITERTMRAVGARGLLEPLPFARIIRDLQMYLRQPAPDAAAIRVGRTVFAATKTRRKVASAASSGTAEQRSNASAADSSKR